MDGCSDSAAQHGQSPTEQRRIEQVGGPDARHKLPADKLKESIHAARTSQDLRDRYSKDDDEDGKQDSDNNGLSSQLPAPLRSSSLGYEEDGTIALRRGLGLDEFKEMDQNRFRNLRVNVATIDETSVSESAHFNGSLLRPASEKSYATPMDDFATLQRATSDPPACSREDALCHYDGNRDPMEAGLRRSRLFLAYLGNGIRKDVLVADAIQVQQDLAAECILSRDFALSPSAHRLDNTSPTEADHTLETEVMTRPEPRCEQAVVQCAVRRARKDASTG
ncbi:hypothetical protein EsDP_00002401 [Epichloe bromicola]|uniref:Uncharacterized protein n=1 Tax=Epichloe bromicola TaxID=79588 RepID=A0ABQ0CKP2_9HYPO